MKVHQRRQHPPHALRDHHQRHRPAVREAQGAGRFHLARLHTLDAGRKISPMYAAASSDSGGAQPVRVAAGEALHDRADAQTDQQDDHHRWQATEDVRVDPGGPAQPAGAGDAGHRQQHADHGADDARRQCQIRVFGDRCAADPGTRACTAPSRRTSPPSCCNVDLGCAVDGSVVEAFCAAMAAKSGSCGSGAALLPGFQPTGSSRGTQSEYSRDHVPSGDHGVETRVEGVDQRLAVLRHRPADVVVEAERVLHDRRRITRRDRALRLLRRRHPRVDLAGLQVRVRGVVVRDFTGSRPRVFTT